MLQKQVETKNKNTNKVLREDYAVHNWYRFVLSYPPHLVRDYFTKFGINSSHNVLDPFCGTGTTIVECMKLGIKGVGVEAHPMMYFASKTKTNWSLDPDALLAHAREVANLALAELGRCGIAGIGLFQSDSLPVERLLRTLNFEQEKLLLKNSISPLPLHKVLVLLECIDQLKDDNFYEHERLALAQSLTSSIGNLHFGPEVGVGPLKDDVDVIGAWLNCVRIIATDLHYLRDMKFVASIVYHADARKVSSVIAPASIDAVFTSPPYPNEKDYTRITRLESVLLGFLQTKADLREIKHSLMGSNTRNVYVDDTDDQWAIAYPEIMCLAEEIEQRRIVLQKTSGFEKLYSRVTKLFFGGMARHLSDLRAILRPGAILGYVVGDQASYFRVMIRTGHHLARIAESLGYEVVSIDLFRTRIATATQSTLREEVVVLRWPGPVIHPYFKDLGVKMENSDQYDTPLFGDNSSEEEDEDSEVTQEDTLLGEKTLSDGKREARYSRIAEHIFFQHYQEGDEKVDFEREEINRSADFLRVKRIKNLGDLNYSFRYRNVLPDSVRTKAPAGKSWVIRSTGRGKYSFMAIDEELVNIKPKKLLTETKIPDATPGIVAMYAKGDEQALLARLRYNRLIDIFTGVTCYSLQNHLRTTVPNMGQVETDEIYVGLDRKGMHYVFPVQAKGGSDMLGIVQIEQDYALCQHRFPDHVKCRPIAAQFMEDNLIALFEFEHTDEGIRIVTEKHYRLVPPDKVTKRDLELYSLRTDEN